MDTQTLPKDKKLIEQIRRALGYFYDEGTNDVYKSQDYTDPVTKKYYSSSSALIDELRSYGIPKDASIKKIELIVEQWYETLSKTPEYTDPTTTDSVSPTVGTRDIQESERQYRESETEKSEQDAEKKVEDLIARLEKAKNRRLWARPKDTTKPLPTVTLSKEDAQKIHEITKLNSLEVEKNIRYSIPAEDADLYTPQQIKSATEKLIETQAIFSQYQSSDQIPLTYTNPSIVSPATALLDTSNPIFVTTFTDPKLSTIITTDTTYSLLAITQESDDLRKIIEYYTGPNIASVVVGGDEIVPYTLAEEETPDSVELTETDIENLIKNGEKVKQYLIKNVGGSGTDTTVFISGNSSLLGISSGAEFTVDTEKVLKSKTILGGIEGKKNQGDLARAYAKERAKLLQSKPIELGVVIGEGGNPVNFQVAGVGKSTESLISFLKETKTPLILTSVAVGTYATNEMIASRAISGLFGGKPLLFFGVGKYNIQIVNSANFTLGGVPMSRFVAGFQLGSRSFNIEFTKKAGQIISSTLIKSAGGVVTRTALPSVITKIIAFFGGFTGPVGFVISTALSLVISKTIEFIGKILPPEKIKKWLENAKEIILGSGLASMMLLPVPFNMIVGVPLTVIGGAAGVAAGGFSTAGITTVAGGIGNIIKITLLTAWEGIAGPIIFILLGFPIIIALILFIINSGAYVVPPGPLSGNPGSFSSPYMDVQKTSTVNSLQNSDLTKTVSYTIKIKPKKGNLSNIRISDNCQVISKTQKNCPIYVLPESIPNIDASMSTGYIFTYVMVIDKVYTDSSIINTITVTADTAESANVSASSSNSITIGNPPISCPVIGGHVATPELNYSYNGSNNTGHGSQRYWDSGMTHYAIPQSTSCISPSDCSYFGYAYDVFPSGPNDVFAPTVLGKDTSWNCSFAFSNGGGSAGYTYHCLSTDGNAMLVLTHVNKDIKSGVVKSGERIGSLYNQGSNTHLHIEFQLNGRYVKPENYFCNGK